MDLDTNNFSFPGNKSQKTFHLYLCIHMRKKSHIIGLVKRKCLYLPGRKKEVVYIKNKKNFISITSVKKEKKTYALHFSLKYENC